MIIASARCRALAALGVAALACALNLPRADAVAPGTWGPDRIPYLDGIICQSATARTALVSWPGPGGAPAFATDAVTGPLLAAPPGTGTTNPAVGGQTRALTAASNNLGESAIGALAYLISTHGRDGGPIVGDIAATVIDQVSGNTTVNDCLDQRQGGTAPETAGQLLAEATSKAGPYTVAVAGPPTGRLVPKRPAALTVTVTAASGRPAAGLTVRLGANIGALSLSSATAVTDSAGQVHVTATVGADASARAARITATVSAVTGLVETRAAPAVPLVSAAAPTTFSGAIDLGVDTTPDPHLSFTGVSSLVLAGGTLTGSIAVTGLRGHAGIATVTAYGPLRVTPKTGCSTHTEAEWAKLRAARTAIAAEQVIVRADGTYPIPPVANIASGCYHLDAVITTNDAEPNVTRRLAGPVVAVVPVAVKAQPPASGIAPVGRLTTTVNISGGYPGSLQAVRAQLLGPRAPQGSGCPTTGWASAGDASATFTVRTTGSATTGSATTVRSSAVRRVGCYGFRVTANLVLPELGSVPVTITPGNDNPAVLVIAPSVSVTTLSSTDVTTGGRLKADVVVASTQDQRGTLSLELHRLPYTYRGCFAADWSHSAVVASTSTPITPTVGDNRYRVSTPTVPSTGCWTVVPVFHAAANPAVTASGRAGEDPMLAFTGVNKVRSGPVAAISRRPADDGLRVGITGALLGLVLLVTTLATMTLAGRDRTPAFDPMATLHL